jgi:hypothetical protein
MILTILQYIFLQNEDELLIKDKLQTQTNLKKYEKIYKMD